MVKCWDFCHRRTGNGWRSWTRWRMCPTALELFIPLVCYLRHGCPLKFKATISGMHGWKICFLLKAHQIFAHSPLTHLTPPHPIPCSVYLRISFLSSLLQRREEIWLIRLALDIGWDTPRPAWPAGTWPSTLHRIFTLSPSIIEKG